MSNSAKNAVKALKDAGKATSDFVGPILMWVFEFLTNTAPLIFAIILVSRHSSEFQHVREAIFVGVGATVFAIVPVLTRPKEREPGVKALEKMQPVVDKMSWALMAAVLLLSAVDVTTHIFYPDDGENPQGIPGLTQIDYHFPFAPKWSFSTLDIVSILVGLVAIFVPILVAKRAERVGITNEKKLQIVLTWIFFLLTVCAVLLGLVITCNLNGDIPNSPAIPQPDITAADFNLALIGIILFLVGYLGNHRTLFELFPFECRFCRRERSHSSLDSSSEEQQPDQSAPPNTQAHSAGSKRTKDDRLLWLRTLHSLVFEAVVLPPIIVSAAVVSGALDEGTAAVYGAFVYSGFSVWNLSSKVIEGPDWSIRLSGLFAVLLQFLYSFLMTILWCVLFWRMRIFVKDSMEPFAMEVFNAVLRFAIAAILVQVVFGTVYRNAWGRSLSDRWLVEGPEYAVVATIVCIGVAAMSESNEKLYVVLGVVAVLIFMPAWLLRRSLAAYVLMRVLPGRAEEVKKSLMAAEVDAAVVYGNYDVIAKLEVRGRPKSFRAGPEEDSRNLGVLAALVKRVVRRSGIGVRETQTLLDFSDFVHLPPIISAADSPTPSPAKTDSPPEAPETEVAPNAEAPVSPEAQAASAPSPPPVKSAESPGARAPSSQKRRLNRRLALVRGSEAGRRNACL